MSDELSFLQEWYSGEADGDWEHQYGVEIGTLDNPGWRLKVDLVGTALEGRMLAREVVARSDTDWFQAWSDGAEFHAACGAQNLTEAIRRFRIFVDAHQAA